MNGADAIAEVLRREGTEFLACFPGPAADRGLRPGGHTSRAVPAGARGHGHRRRFQPRERRQAAWRVRHAARARLRERPSRAAQAFADNVPVLLIPGGEPTSRSFTPPGFSATDNYRGVTKWLAEVNDVERVPELMRRAFHHLRSGKPGPVLLEVARDVWDQEIAGELDYAPVKASRSAAVPRRDSRSGPGASDAQNPVIHAGQGVLYSEASDELGAAGGVAPGAGDDHDARQERVPREPPAFPRRLRGFDHQAHRALPEPRRRGARHGVQLHPDRLR